MTTLMRLSLATPSSIDAPLKSENILLVHSRRQAACLDEAPLTAAATSTIHQVGGEISAPVAKRKVDPEFPESARRAMGSGTNVIITVRCIISRDGCVRAVKLVSQSPFPAINGAAIHAVAQWTFEPARLKGEPVDVEFNLTINFKTG